MVLISSKKKKRLPIEKMEERTYTPELAKFSKVRSLKVTEKVGLKFTILVKGFELVEYNVTPIEVSNLCLGVKVRETKHYYYTIAVYCQTSQHSPIRSKPIEDWIRIVGIGSEVDLLHITLHNKDVNYQEQTTGRKRRQTAMSMIASVIVVLLRMSSIAARNVPTPESSSLVLNVVSDQRL